jgi:hypothetical protein
MKLQLTLAAALSVGFLFAAPSFAQTSPDGSKTTATTKQPTDGNADFTPPIKDKSMQSVTKQKTDGNADFTPPIKQPTQSLSHSDPNAGTMANDPIKHN